MNHLSSRHHPGVRRKQSVGNCQPRERICFDTEKAICEEISLLTESVIPSSIELLFLFYICFHEVYLVAQLRPVFRL